MIQVLNDLKVGSRVWSLFGYPDHGPLKGPRVTIPSDIGGLVVNTEPPLMDQLLYIVRWDTGHISKHYFKELCSIGQYATLSDFQQAVETANGKAEVVVGPQGGFRQASADLVLNDGSTARIEVYGGQGHIWDSVMKPPLLRSAVVITEKRLEAKKPGRSIKKTG
jgi:hypothetical protein